MLTTKGPVPEQSRGDRGIVEVICQWCGEVFLHSSCEDDEALEQFRAKHAEDHTSDATPVGS